MELKLLLSINNALPIYLIMLTAAGQRLLNQVQSTGALGEENCRSALINSNLFLVDHYSTHLLKRTHIPTLGAAPLHLCLTVVLVYICGDL